jgi:hypothetical protein
MRSASKQLVTGMSIFFLALLWNIQIFREMTRWVSETKPCAGGVEEVYPVYGLSDDHWDSVQGARIVSPRHVLIWDCHCANSSNSPAINSARVASVGRPPLSFVRIFLAARFEQSSICFRLCSLA